MVQTLQFNQAFNPALNFVPDVYLQVIPPQAYLTGVPTSVAACVGTGSWGPLNVASLIGSPQQLQQVYGPVQPAAVSDVHDLCFDVAQALSQGSSSALSVYGIRVSDGTDVAASVMLYDDEAVEETATVAGSITPTDVLSITLTNVAFTGGLQTISYTVQEEDTVTIIAAAFVTAVGANGVLTAAGVTAINTAGVVKFSWPNTLGPITFTKTLSAGATETITFANAAVAGITLTAKWTGTLGNQIQVFVGAGGATNTATVTVVPYAGAGSSEIYTGLPTTTTAFWAALQTAINMGQGATRPPSNYLVASGASNSALAPLFGGKYLSGGTDGRSVTSANLLGSNTASPPTGIYALEGVQFTPSVMWVCGLTDSSIYPNILSFCTQNNIFGLLTFPSGTAVATAVTDKNSYGIQNYQIAYMYGWVYVFDQANNVVRLVPPLATAGGYIATIAPEQSPFNSAVNNILGTERTNPYTGTNTYSYSDIAQLTQAGICFLANPIPGGNEFGFRNGCNSVGNNAVTSPIEYSRLTNYLVLSNGSILGTFEGQLQSTSNNDPLRAQISSVLNSFYQELLNAGRIGGFLVICNTTNNSFQTISQHELIVQEEIQYLASVLTILAQIQGGTTVQTVSNTLGNQIPSA